MDKITLSSTINLRVTEKVKKEFEHKASRSGRRPVDILRELIDAYIEGRLVVESRKF